MINKKNSSGINDSYENKESVKERKGEDPLKERIILFSRQMSLIYQFQGYKNTRNLIIYHIRVHFKKILSLIKKVFDYLENKDYNQYNQKSAIKDFELKINTKSRFPIQKNESEYKKTAIH